MKKPSLFTIARWHFSPSELAVAFLVLLPLGFLIGIFAFVPARARRFVKRASRAE